MNDADIRRAVAERIPAIAANARKMRAVKEGDLTSHWSGDKLYATFILDGFRLTAVV